MTTHPPSADHRADGVARSRRSSLATLRATVRNPLTALPPEAFRHGVTLSSFFGRPRIHLTDPVLIQEAFVRQADALEKTSINQRVLGPAFGNGLLTSSGAHWRHQRRAISPAFQHDRLLALLPAMIAAAEETRDRWLAAARTHERIDLGHEMMRTTFRIIVDTMLSGPGGIDVAGVERSMSDYLAPTSWIFALGLIGAPTWVPFPGHRRFRQASGYLRGTVNAMVAERRRAGAGPEDLVALLLRAADPETGQGMTDEEIADNLLTFIAAGHETTANALTWTLALLQAHPEDLHAVVGEIDTVVGNGPVKPEHVARLTYTRQVLDEAMRLYPPAPIIARRVRREMDLGGMKLHPGTPIILPIYALHRNVGIWTDPEAFQPARFAPDAAKARHRYAYMPFGAGPRVCIGNAFAVMEAVAILAVLLKSVRLEAVAPLPAATMQVTLRPTTPILMNAAAR